MLAKLWAQTVPEDRTSFKSKAEKDSIRYKEQMVEYRKTDAFKRCEKLKMNRKMKHRQEKKRMKTKLADKSSNVPFDLFVKDHGGSLDEIRQLWGETSKMIKDEYEDKAAKMLQQPRMITSRSRRIIRLPFKLSDSISSTTPKIWTRKKSPVKQKSASSSSSVKLGSFENYVNSMKVQYVSLPDREMLQQLTSDWNNLTDDEKDVFNEDSDLSLDYRALDDGDLFFNEDEDDDDEDEDDEDYTS
jgi:hypothetical protein